MTNEEILEITSLANPRIKEVAKLVKDGHQRKAKKIIIVDGQREIEEGLRMGWEIKEFYYCADFVKNISEINSIIARSEVVYKLSKKVFEKISYKKNPDGCLAVITEKYLNFSDIKLKENPLVLVLESVEKPGNLGAMIRTAYVAGVDLLILNDQKTDIYSPNVIRSSTGFIFSLPLILSSVDETFKWLKDNRINIFTTSLKGSKTHFEADFTKPTALVFGTESFGLSHKWQGAEVEAIKIPMIANVDSLNVSVSAGVIVYEALRQRKFNFNI